MNSVQKDNETQCQPELPQSESNCPDLKVEAGLWAARFGYIVFGMIMAFWASMIPYTKDRLGLTESELGVLLLCLGGGAIFSMPISGALAAKYGCKKVQNIGIPAFLLSLITLTLVPHPILLGINLAIFGGISGILDVVMNVQVVFWEKAGNRKLMSHLHAMYTVGVAIGSVFAALLLGFSFTPFWMCVLLSVLMLCLQFFVFAKYFYPYGGDKTKTKRITVPTGSILLLGCLCFIFYMVEGVVLDWGALFMFEERSVPLAEAGLAFGLFATTMTLGRLYGDRLGASMGDKKLLLFGTMLTGLGFLLVSFLQNEYMVYFGFFLAGLGTANLSPCTFNLAAKNKTVDVGSAIAGVSTVGYLGMLAGPAIMGFVAEALGLAQVFLVMALLVFASLAVSFFLKEDK